MAGLRSAQEDPQCKVWVGRLAFSTKPDSLARHMAHAGVVVSCGVLGENGTTDGSTRSRCSGFVSYQTRAETSKAIALLDGSILDGRKIWVDRWTTGWNPADAAMKGDVTQPRWTDPRVEYRDARAPPTIQHAASSELEGLEKRLRCLRPARASVHEAMVFCIDNCSQHGSSLARRLVRALVEADLGTEMVIARLFLISDVLYNSNCRVQGADKFRSSFQELLPDAFEHLGRLCIRRPGLQRVEQMRAQSVVRHVLTTWQAWSVFPPLFTKGLESLVFAPVLENVYPQAETSEALRRKLSGGKQQQALNAYHMKRGCVVSQVLPFAPLFAARGYVTSNIIGIAWG
eukprot:CAMPEP_0117457694 /NCGR_PEP_ID=MMETSP0784-20121206/541_1 /TAXON_ID=39447 /ORGANISM="" /LENGTH=344 /DNA_ID=CAMNT_0005251177 /DNA_START=28 /DNA_END=1063 /DNA_ORIENTATION=-